ncbi:hypothetical protein [Streptomyces sp. NBC_01304]|uniref:hypothetical protein n=1 Tax=Streptomyces sp. NBC_01304 TaxID=2903818 RepID=UPI002E127F8B|nr:hypothetical protein OG430_23365 [Streptomyces sp. NBC_01304]
MSSTTSWILLVVCTVLILPSSLALAAGWIPAVIRHRPGPVRVLGAAGISMYGAALCELAPRIAQAARETVTAGAYAAVVLAGVTVVLVMAYDMVLGRPKPLEKRPAR